MNLDPSKISQLLASPTDLQSGNRVSIGRQETVEIFGDVFPFVERLTLRARFIQDRGIAAVDRLRKRLSQIPLNGYQPAAKLITLIKSANEEGIGDLSITMTKAAALELRGKVTGNIVPGGAQLCFAAQPSGHITLYVKFH
jgi:hypothetical protein